MLALFDHLPNQDAFRRAAATDGGEHAGPCPSCGGEDRFRVWPEKGESGRFWCRRCDWSGDGIDLLRSEHGGRHSFPDACRALGLAHKLNSPATGDGQAGAVAAPSASKPRPKPPRLLRAPGPAWQREGLAFVEECRALLWKDTAAAARARQYLTGRGFTEDTIRAVGLGFNPEERRPLRTSWGLDPKDGEEDGGTVWLPRGIVIPWWREERGLWKVQVRRSPKDLRGGSGPKYVQAAAVKRGEGQDPGWSSNGLYGARALTAGRPAVLVEGVFDALAVMQAARTEDGQPLVAAVACGSSGARRPRWIAKLSTCAPVLLAFDTDANEAGADAAVYWEEALPEGVRHAPPAGAGDPAGMLEAGQDVKAWIEAGLRMQVPQSEEQPA